MSEKQELQTFRPKQPVRMAFANLLTPRKFKDKGVEKGDAKYSASFIFESDSDDIKTLKSMVGAALKAQYPGKQIVPRRLTQQELDDGGYVEVNVPWQDGTRAADKAQAESKDQEFFRGKIVVKASSKFAPSLSAVEGGKIVEYSNPETRGSLSAKFYSGATVVPYFALNLYPARDNKPGGCGVFLQAVFFVKATDKIGGGGVNSAEIFRDYAGAAVNVDPGSNAPAEEW